MPEETEEKAVPNFSGFVSRANLKCGDGRTILPGAFAEQSGTRVPLTFEHNDRDITQLMGVVELTDTPEGTWGDVYLNEAIPAAKNADALVKNKDLKMFSIRAGELIERGLDVVKGKIKEVSLTMSGSNAGARIENYNDVLAHSGMDEEDLLLVIGGEIMHTSGGAPAVEAEPEAEKTNGDVLATLTPEQAQAVNDVFTAAVEEAVTTALTEAAELEADSTTEPPADGADVQHNDSNTEGTNMPRNRFDSEKQNYGPTRPDKELLHSDVVSILSAAKGTPGNIADFNENSATGSLREFVRKGPGKELFHADTYGIDNMDVMFPDAQNIMNRPTWVDRRQDWVKVFMAGTVKTPFSRVKTMYADITADEARARGYIKGNQKVDEVFPVFKRSTGPAWIYKRQKLDRQDIIDIVDFDVVAWMKAEMRGKLDEEIARAGLLGDGRPVMIGSDMNPDKIQEPAAEATSGDGIRSILNDADLYTTTYSVPMASASSPTDDELYNMVDQVVVNREDYLGSGNLTCFMSYRLAAKLLTRRDEFKHRVYSNLDALAGEMDVQRITRVPSSLMEDADALMIIVDLADYNFGANKGGEVTLFDDFDINVNQYIYLMETYLSGAQTIPYCSQVYRRVTGTLVVPNRLLFTNPDTVEFVAQTGVVYKRKDTGATLAADIELAEGESVTVEAFPASTYYFTSNYDGVDSNDYEYGDPTG